jgi:hypothetical protein
MDILRKSLFAGAFAAALCLLPVSFAATSKVNKEKPKSTAATTNKEATSKKVRTAEGTNTLGKKETLTGTLSMVDPSHDLVVVKDSGNIPFDFKVTKSTKIEVGETSGHLSGLASELHQRAQVTFVPMDNGDFARTIKVTAG